ncbi:STAS domain-containing protein [Bacillus sp. MUM 13]|uniref:STAS domain-containing protein n=1 Tax=Bacillus sp. MUM 13 TaxID=1678001 RepID=UPI0008F5ADB0|nr:STAS domain-containing protein [Bacillus sp. MUM 13]OIK09984.1 anti-anti-sigma factor [Bacillus sp. MUM 13]
MSLTVNKEIFQTTVILKIIGILDISTINGILPFLELGNEVDKLIFDFSDLEFIDSTGIGIIIEAIYQSQEANFTIEIKGLDEETHEILETVGVFKILEAIQGEAC